LRPTSNFYYIKKSRNHNKLKFQMNWIKEML